MRLHRKSKYSPMARWFIGPEIDRLVHEGVDQQQAIAIALDEARRRGYKVPKKPTGVLQ